MAFSFEKPVIISNKLKPYLKSRDFENNFSKAQLEEKNLFKDFEKNKKISFNNKLIAQLIQFSKLMKASRDYKKISKKYLNTLQ